jgi:hypothetical protein
MLDKGLKVFSQIVLFDGRGRGDFSGIGFPRVEDFGLDLFNLRIGFAVFFPNKVLTCPNDDLESEREVKRGQE